MEAIRQLLKKYFPLLAVLLGVIFFALGKPTLGYLIQLGQSLSVPGLQLISVCNVLFIGNISAGLIALVLFGYKNIYHDWKETDRKTRLNLLAISFLIIISTMLIFEALKRTSIINIVILSQFDGIFYLALMIFFLKIPLKKNYYIGYSFIGLGLTILLAYIYATNSSFNETVIGDLLVIVFAFVSALVGLRIKKSIKHISIGLQIVALNITSAVVFLFLGIFVFGPKHFIDIFHASLWLTLGAYALIVIVLGQICFYYGIRRISDLAMVNTLMLKPIVTVFFAYILLSEMPSYVQLISFAIILLGMIISNILKLREAPEETSEEIRHKNYNIIGKH